ncbi:MAG: NDP-sugar synthase [bacterium]|jgi:MurNAc alpha-1-phosphate uridylyltransferase
MIKIQDAKAMIFAAGLGTRLKPFTDIHPKALAVVNGKTLLERNIDYLHGFGINNLVINIHHFADQIKQFVERYRDTDIHIELSHEIDGPYETGGGLAFAASYLRGSSGPFVVMNADILTNLDLNGMFEFHQKIKPLATLAVSKRESSRQLLFDDQMKLVGWKNNKTQEIKWVGEEQPSAEAFSFSGIHVLSPLIFDLMPSSGTFSITDMYLILAQEHQIIGYNHTGDVVIDVGKPESVFAAESIFK